MYKTSVENEKPAKGFSWAPWALLLAVIIGSAALFLSHKKGLDDCISMKSEEAAAVTRIQINEENLPGTYGILVQSGDIENRYTGLIDQDELGVYQLHVYSEYEPRILRLDLQDDGTVSNEELGVGVMSARNSSGSVEITFEKGGVKCVLSR